MKKSKFNLFSYVVEGDMIFFKSLNKNKLLSFMIIRVIKFGSFISLLNEYLIKRYIKYFSLQIKIKIKSNQKIVIICFEDEEKDRIVKIHNFILNKLEKERDLIEIFNSNHLEDEFLNFGTIKFDSRSNLTLKSNSIILNEEQNTFSINMYNLNLDTSNKKDLYLQNLEEYLLNREIECNIIFHFAIDLIGSILVYSHIMEIQKSNFSNQLLDNVNNFFAFNILQKKKINLEKFGLSLWRYKIFEDYVFFEEISEIFGIINKIDRNELEIFNFQFEKILHKKKIKFNRINEILLLIDRKILFITFIEFEPRILFNYFKKYSTKYIIYIFVPIDTVYTELQKIEKINQLNKVKIFNKNDFLNLEIFGNKLEMGRLEKLFC